MSNVAHLRPILPTTLAPVIRAARPQLTVMAPNRTGDSAEISVVARMKAKLAAGPVRTALVDRIRAELARGAYTLDDKLDAALDNLAADLR